MDGASIDPGPTDGSILVLQKQHHSRAVWEGYGDSKVENATLICRRNDNNLQLLERPSPRIVELIYQAGFGGILEMPFITLDRAFITALIERWRPETHTFHLRSGESTVTLQDVEIITGLAVDGRPVTGDSRFDKDKKKELCERLLGLDPPGEVMSGFKVSLKWLRDNFNGKVEEGDDEVTVLRKARGYILQLIGGIVLPDQSSSHVHLYFLSLLDDLQLAGTYSWGSACLATLYHYLDFGSTVGSKDLGGMFILLQVWGWERFPFLAPARNGKRVIRRDSPLSGRWDDEFHSPNLPTHVVGHYRFSLDVQRPDEVVWQPYTEDLIQSLPRFCSAGRGVWMASVPLIQFSHVEQHQPERVLLQFGGRQTIPPPL
ncbi:serine/threonine-protein phosphatase 7 long form homolog [Rhododendron vialii]|uniref:serine/threonine-protein phosphatase 7 long form homolog n=1 Tax=Rhododendron vialii TaxID=182163 RepID=UPI002660580C|nr:serine/threonine-protein phosphatase 7 long form homolog [Rhododendron vialii]